MNSITTASHIQIKEYVALTKPRITLLVLITAYAGMWLAAGGPPAFDLSLIALLGIGMASAASAVLNNYFDRDIDRIMSRTQQRSLPSGRVHPKEALWLGLILNLLAFVVLLVGVNSLSAWLALGTVFTYVVIYTLWLKRISPLCTAIGGIAGALPPVIGWASVTNQFGEPALILFAILFLWQPPHFWALAMLRTDEYRKAKIPMLPVVKGEHATKRQILLYTLALWPVSVLLYTQGWVGELYFITAMVGGFIYTGLTIIAIIGPLKPQAMKRLFLVSIVYLFVLFLAVFVS